VAGPRPDVAGHADARAELVRRFLGAYAPASARAFGEWAGLGPAEADASFAALGDEIVAVRLDRRSAMALAVDQERLHEPVAVVVGARLVPAGDPFLHQRDRATLLPDPDHRRQLWRPAGAPGLVLIDGTPSGVWRHKQARSHVAVTADLWTPPDPDLASALTTEAATVLSTTPDKVHVDVRH